MNPERSVSSSRSPATPHRVTSGFHRVTHCAPSSLPLEAESTPELDESPELAAMLGEIALRDERIRELEHELEARDERIRELEAELLHGRTPQASRAEPSLVKPWPSLAPPDSPLDSAVDDLVPDAESTESELITPDYGGEPCPSLQRLAVREEPEPAPPQRRRAERQLCEFELTFLEETHFYSGLTQDISTGGMFIATYNLLPIGTPLTLSFELWPGQVIEVNGVVRWVREEAADGARPGLGVAFTDLSPEALSSIQAFCALRPPLVYEL